MFLELGQEAFLWFLEARSDSKNAIVYPILYKKTQKPP